MTVKPAVRAAVIHRAQHSCERCGVWVDVENGSYSLQHRRARGMGGSSRADTDTAVNLAVLCGHATEPDRCHSYIEAHPQQAADHGWRVPQHQDPATVPIRHHEHGDVLLTTTYMYEEIAA